MHLSQETFDQIASLLQNDAKQFRRRKLTESISFKKTDLGYAITLDNMGIGKLSIKDNQFAFSSHSALGEVFNKTLFDSLEECQAAIVSHMMGDKPETEQLDEEADELEEAVKVSHDRYVRSTGKKATGSGNWMFTHKKMGDVNWKDEKDFFNARGSLAAASKEAKEWAKKHGYSVVYVMESAQFDKLDEGVGLKFPKTDLKGWKAQAEKTGLRIRAAVDADGDSGKRWTASDKNGNLRGEFHVNTGGKLQDGKGMYKEDQELDEKYNDDDHIIMQLRKAQDVDGKIDIKFHSGPSGRLSPSQIKQILNTYNNISPEGKRRMKIMMRTLKSTLDMLKEEQELDETAYEKGMDPKKKVVVQGVKGMKSRPFKKTFRNEAAYDKWADSPAAEDVTVHRVYQEEVEMDESTIPFFYKDMKTRTPMKPEDELNALRAYIKRARSESGSGSNQKLYVATQRFQHLLHSMHEEDELNEAGERLGVKSAQFDKLDAWEGRAKAKGFKVTKNNKSGTYYAWNGTKVVGTFTAHGKHFGGELREEADCDEDDKKDKKKGKKKDSEEMDMEPKAMKESVKIIVARLKEGRSDGYALYHPTYSAAVQEALNWATRKGFKVNEDDYFNKVTTGPRKPTPGKTVSHSLALDNNKRKQLHLQVYNTGNSFELNCYVS